MNRSDVIATDLEASVIAEGPALAPRPVVLEGACVRLEPLMPAHVAGLFACIQGEDQPQLLRYTSDNPVPDENGMRALLAEKLSHADRQYFALCDKASGGACGFLALMRADTANRVIELGNLLFLPPARGNRAGTEAIFLLLRHAFEDLGYRRVEWKCDDRNRGSRHAALRCGFSFEGVFRQHMIVKGRNRDSAWFSLLDHEWPSRRAAFERWLSPDNFDAAGRQKSALSELNGVGGT